MPPSPLTAAIIVAAGRGSRAASADEPPKQYRALAGRPMLARSIAAFLDAPEIDLVQPVISADDAARFAALGLDHPKLLPPVTGGAERQESVRAGLEALDEHAPDRVLVHDAARPLVGRELIGRVCLALDMGPAVLPALPISDTLKRSRDGRSVDGTADRRALYAAQTPQGFAFAPLLDAHRRAAGSAEPFTDDASIAEWAGLAVAMVPGETDNFKVTLPEDFRRAERMLEQEMRVETRIGSGFDVHPFAPGDRVHLGGIEIAHDHGLAGHSDADVVLHALSDALYGAVGAGDIGTHFPPSDPQWRGAASTIFVSHAAGMVRERGGRIVNLDVTLVCEAPRIAPHVPAMQKAIAAACAISSDRVAIKATTAERLGFIGRREGMIAMATASVELPRKA